MKKILLLTLSISLLSFSYAQKTYKAMMYDMSINFYEVCDEAEKYFETHDKTVKGSGWKGFQRWKIANETRFYPDGNRENTDPLFIEKAFNGFKANNPAPKSLFTNGWNELGPFRIDSISGHYAAGLGRVEDHYVNPNNTNLMYLGSRSGGFWKTTDGGANWQGGSTDFLIATGVNTIGVSPTNPDSILINVRNSRNGNSHGIYRSIDGGNSWVSSNFNPTSVGQGGLGDNFQIYKIVYHPTIPNLVFIGTNEGLYRSSDNLATWTQLLTNGFITDISFHPTNAQILYVYDNYYWGANEDYVLRSLDAGLTFSQSNQIVGNNEATGYLSVSTDCPDCLYFASSNGIWKSTDNGINYTFLSNPNESCLGFAVNDLDTSKMIYGYVDIDRSTDGGKTFTDATRWSLGNTNGAGSGHQVSFNTSTNYVHADLHPAKCINGVFYVGTDGLMAKSTDNGLNWTVISQGTAIRENYKLGASQSNHYRTISGSQDNGTSIKHQNNWIEFYGADGMEGLIHPLNDDWMISSLQYGGRRRTKDGGVSQSGISPSGQSGSGNAAWEAPITYDPNNHMRIYNFSDSIYVSDEFGSNWTYRGIPSSFTGTISHSAIAENNSDIIVISKGDDIDRSIDGGLTFNSIKSNLPNYSIEDIAFDPNDDNTIIVVYARYQNDNSKVFRTTNGGLNWVNITNNLNNMPIRSVVIDHTDASNIYLGAELGVFTMPMSGSSWSLYNPNLPNVTVEELEIVNGSNTLKAATWGRGVWEYALVGRLGFPAIVKTKITDQPTDNSPKENKDQFVTSKISYDNTLTSVYVEWSANTPTFGNIINMTNTQDSTWVSDTALPHMAIGTKLYFKVFAVGNNNDTTETYKFMYTTYPFEYCTSSGTTQYQGNVTLVDFNTINNVTGKTQAYTDYSSTDSTEVYVNNAYDLTVNLNTDNGNYEYFSKVWIDWNQDADFDDQNESYELGSVTNNSNAATNLSPLSISIPSFAQTGETKMRVSCRYNGYPSACDNGFDGEVEDYKIIVNENPIKYVIDNEICKGSSLNFNYTGTTATSITWTFSNGVNTYTSTNFSDSIIVDQAGNYQVSIDAVINGNNFTNTANNVFIVNNNINPIITSANNVLTVSPSGLNYNWLNCSKDFIEINGATSQSYTATENGTYAAKAYDNVCIDTSECIQVTGIAIVENQFEEDILVFPNPTNDFLNVKFENSLEVIELKLKNELGQLLFEKQYLNEAIIDIELISYSKGVYFLYIHSKDKSAVFKIIKE